MTSFLFLLSFCECRVQKWPLFTSKSEFHSFTRAHAFKIHFKFDEISHSQAATKQSNDSSKSNKFQFVCWLIGRLDCGCLIWFRWTLARSQSINLIKCADWNAHFSVEAFFFFRLFKPLSLECDGFKLMWPVLGMQKKDYKIPQLTRHFSNADAVVVRAVWIANEWRQRQRRRNSNNGSIQCWFVCSPTHSKNSNLCIALST